MTPIAQDLLAWFPSAVVFATPAGELMGSNVRGEALLKAGDPIQQTGGRLRALCARDSGRLRAALAAPEPCLTVTGASGKPRLVVIRPLTREAGLLAVFIPASVGSSAPDWCFLQRCFEFTPAECRVAMMLASGRAPARIARELAVARSTVKSQARSIYFKAGVERQAELIWLLAQLPAPTVRNEFVPPEGDDRPAAASNPMRDDEGTRQ